MFSYLELLWIWFFGSKITILSSTEILRSEIEERISSFLDLTLPVSCMPIFLLLFATISLKMIYSKYFLSSSIFSLKSVWSFFSLHFSSVTQLCLTLCDPMNHSMPGFPVHHQLPESTQIYVHWVSDAIQPSHPLSSPSPPALNLSQHQGLFKWVSFSHQVAELLEFQLQHQSFQWTPRTDFL